jgi:hypothetical protein
MSLALFIMTCSITSIETSTGILSSVAADRALTGDVSLQDCELGSDKKDWLGSDARDATSAAGTGKRGGCAGPSVVDASASFTGNCWKL